MAKKQKETTGGYRRITICSNEVQIVYYHNETDGKGQEKELCKKTFKEIREKIFGEYRLVEGEDEENISIYSIGEALQVCETPKDSKIQYYIVQGELFVKITTGNMQRIYNKEGHLIAEDEENRLSVLFIGKKIVIRKANKKTDNPNYYSIEGYKI